MTIQITPGRLRGRLAAPPSKSVAHRMIVCASLADGVSEVCGAGGSQDIEATVGAMRALGARITGTGEALRITGVEKPPETALVDCIESGSTLRFLIPVAAALGVEATFTGRGRLGKRPVQAVLSPMAERGVGSDYQGDLPFTLHGTLESGDFAIDAGVSSQFISGLLFALPMLVGDSRVIAQGKLESRPYIEITTAVMRQFGVHTEETGGVWLVPGGQRYRSGRYTVEGDYSGAAFWIAANALGCDIALDGLRPDSVQGDKAIAEIVRRIIPDAARETVIDASDVPDLVPVVAALAACTPGTTRIVGAGRLRIKESDRLATVSELLANLGGRCEEGADCLTIVGQAALNGGVVDSHNDHRIAMSAAIAAIRCRAPVTILGAECVAKSYPQFFEDYKRAGGIADVVNLG